MVYQDRIETVIAAIRTLRKLRRVFYNFCYCFEINIVATKKQA